MDRIRQHAAGDDWRKPDWRDDLIEKWLDDAVGRIAKAANFRELKLPVRLADVKAADLKPAELPENGTISGALVVGKNLDLGKVSLSHCIILADGKVEVRGANNCVVVARGAVQVQLFSHASVLVSGVYVSVLSGDGSPQDSASNGSVILSRGWADVRSAYGSMILAHEGTSLEMARDALFINAALVGGIDRGGNRALRVRGLPVEELPQPPFAKPLRVLGLVRPDATPVDPRQGALSVIRTPVKPPLGIVLTYGDRRYFAEFGQPVLDQDGQPVEDLRGWRVAFSDDALAIFSSDTADVPVRLEGR